MSETIKLSFDDGYKNIELNGNPDKIIRINPTDTQFINRISGFDEKYENIRSRYGDIDMNSINDLQNLDENNPDFEKLKLAADSVDKLDMAVKDLINEIFGYDISLIVFGTDSCLSSPWSLCATIFSTVFGLHLHQLPIRKSKISMPVEFICLYNSV